MLLLSTVLAATLVAEMNLENDDGGFVPSAGDLQWEWGIPTTGPNSALVGTRVWATRLGEPYLNDAEGSIQLPAVDLVSLSAPSLSFWHWTDIDSSDSAVIEVQVGGVWETVDPVYGYPSSEGYSGATEGWEFVVVDLVGVGSLEQVRLTFRADASLQAAGWYVDEVQLWDGDVAPPRVSDLDLLEDTEDLDGPYAVSALVQDDVGLVQVALLVSIDGGAEETMAMSVDDGRWITEIDGQPPDTTVEYAVLASDGTSSTRLPEAGYESFRVRLPAPTDLSGPEGRVVALSVELDWFAPDSIHFVESYRVWSDEELVVTVSEPPATVPIQGDDRFQVSAVYDVGEGDLSEVLEMDSSSPAIHSVEPSELWQGERVTIGIEGSYLLLVDGEVSADLGEDIEVMSVEVTHVDRCELEVQVADDATVGDHAIVLISGDLHIPSELTLQVLDGDDRPKLIEVDPDSLVQGESATLRLRASEPFYELPLVSLGDGVVVEEITESADDTVLVYVVVSPIAPIGWRAVEADDGSRLLTGVDFRVKPYAPPVETCSHAPGAAGLLALFILLARRRD